MKNYKYSIGLSAILLTLLGCGGGDDKKTSTDKVKVSGVVVLNQVKSSTVTIKSMEGKVYGTGKTDSKGNFSISLSEKPTGALKFVTKGGTYLSESNLSKTVSAVDLCTLLPKLSTKETSITALSTLVCAYTEFKIESGTSFDKAFDEGNKKLGEIFGFDKSIDFSTTVPNLTKSGIEIKSSEALLSLISGVFERMAERSDLTPEDFYKAIISDIEDGKFDGKSGSTIIESASSTFYTDFLAALNDYTSNVEGTALAEAGVSSSDVKESEIGSDLVTAIVAVAPVSSGLNIGSSGAVTTLSYLGKQFVYVAARSRGLVGADISDPESPKVVDLDALNGKIYDAMTTASAPAKLDNSKKFKRVPNQGTNFNLKDKSGKLTKEGKEILSANGSVYNLGGVIAIPGLANPAVMVYAYESKTVVLVDVVNQTLLGATTLNISTTQGFSGGSAYISSGIFDIARGGVWLATHDGYWFVDVSTMTASSAPVPLANGQIIAENIGANTAENMLFSPNYGKSYGGGLQWVKLDTNKAYSLKKSEWDTNIGTLSGMGYADAGSVDSTYKVGIISPEDSSNLAFINLSNPALFSFSDANKTFSINGNTALISSFNLAGNAGGNPIISHASIDSSTHLMLLTAGFSSTIGVARLTDPSSVTGGTPWTPISDWSYYNASFSEYTYARDPHASGVINNSFNHRSYGYILSDDGYILQVDMEAFLSSSVTDSTGASYNSNALSSTPFGGSVIRIAL